MSDIKIGECEQEFRGIQEFKVMQELTTVEKSITELSIGLETLRSRLTICLLPETPMASIKEAENGKKGMESDLIIRIFSLKSQLQEAIKKLNNISNRIDL